MHLATYTKADAGKMISHYERSIGERDHIDGSGEVYNLAPEFAGGPKERFKALCKGLDIGAKTKPLADFVVTMPKGYEGDRDEFFRAVYEELAERVGAENIVCAYVHADEPDAQPHMHFAFVPVVEVPVMTNSKEPLKWTEGDEKKNPAHKAGTQKTDSKGTPRWKRVQAKDESGNPMTRKTAKASAMFTREALRELHPKMEAALCKRLGVERVGITLEADDPKKPLSALTHDQYERVTAAVAEKQGELDGLRDDVKAKRSELSTTQQKLESGRDELEKKSGELDALKSEVAQERERLERVRRAADELESVAERVTVAEHAPVGKQGEGFGGVVRACADALGAVLSGLPEKLRAVCESALGKIAGWFATDAPKSGPAISFASGGDATAPAVGALPVIEVTDGPQMQKQKVPGRHL